MGKKILIDKNEDKYDVMSVTVSETKIKKFQNFKDLLEFLRDEFGEV